MCGSNILTYRELLAPEMDPAMVSLFTGFGSGVGESGCMCGALTGSISALNMLKGRTSNQTSRDEPIGWLGSLRKNSRKSMA